MCQVVHQSHQVLTTYTFTALLLNITSAGLLLIVIKCIKVMRLCSLFIGFNKSKNYVLRINIDKLSTKVCISMRIFIRVFTCNNFVLQSTYYFHLPVTEMLNNSSQLKAINKLDLYNSSSCY